MIIKAKSKIDRRFKHKKIADLIETPNVVYVSEFNTMAAKKFSEDMMAAQDTNDDVIPVIIDSYGGEVYALLSMVDTIKRTSLPVATVAMGKVMSAGSILFSCGTQGYRYISPNATMMIHEVTNCAFGKVEDLKVEAREVERLNDLVMELLDTNCTQAQGYFKKLVHDCYHADWYLTPKDAVTHNLANHIKVPEFTIDVSVKVNFG